MENDFCCFLNSNALSGTKLAVKTDPPAFLGRGQSVQHESVEHSRECVEGRDKLQREGLGNLLPPWLGCSAGPVADWGQIPVLPCSAKYISHGPLDSGVGGSSFCRICFTETEHKLSGWRFILLESRSFFQGCENALRQHRKTVSHPVPPVR